MSIICKEQTHVKTHLHSFSWDSSSVSTLIHFKDFAINDHLLLLLAAPRSCQRPHKPHNFCLGCIAKKHRLVVTYTVSKSKDQLNKIVAWNCWWWKPLPKQLSPKDLAKNSRLGLPGYMWKPRHYNVAASNTSHLCPDPSQGYVTNALHPGKLTWNLKNNLIEKENHLSNLHVWVPC